MLQKAITLAWLAHAGQTDKYGAPYIGHVMRVMGKGRTQSEKVLGALHDVVEDSDISLGRVSEEGFEEDILQGLDALTIRDGEDYDSYLGRVARNPLALRVKLNDLEDNMDLRRVNRPLQPADLERLNKYVIAYQKLAPLLDTLGLPRKED